MKNESIYLIFKYRNNNKHEYKTKAVNHTIKFVIMFCTCLNVLKKYI